MASTATPTTATAPGLVVAATDPIRSFLSSASTSEDLAADLRGLASALSSDPAVPYRSLRAIWCAASPDARPPLRGLLQGTEFVLPSPKPREKSAELKERLEKLREMQERKEYAELVKDVAPPSEDDSPEPFSSYKDQIGFGLHVVVIMFTGYLVGFAAFRALFSNSPVLNAAGGILGLVGGMLVETVLFIIRSSSKELASSVSRSKKVQCLGSVFAGASGAIQSDTRFGFSLRMDRIDGTSGQVHQITFCLNIMLLPNMYHCCKDKYWIDTLQKHYCCNLPSSGLAFVKYSGYLEVINKAFWTSISGQKLLQTEQSG